VLIQPIRGAGPDNSGNAGSFESMALLLRSGVDPNVARFGQTALHFAAGHHGPAGENARARFAALLLDHRARLNVRDDLLQSTPLAWACRWGRKDLAEVLVARGVDVAEPDAEPWATPQSWAKKMNRPEISRLLESASNP
jgi:ankyrin repeat protein